MSKMIFVNLPVADVAKSTAFYKAIGAIKNPQFSDDTTSAMVISDTIVVMLLEHQRFRDFTTKTIADARTTVEVLLCVSQESREAVGAAVDKATKAGGTADPTPTQDFGLMYGRSYEDLDGHIRKVMWMDAEAAAHSAKAGEAP